MRIIASEASASEALTIVSCKKCHARAGGRAGGRPLFCETLNFGENVYRFQPFLKIQKQFLYLEHCQNWSTPVSPLNNAISILKIQFWAFRCLKFLIIWVVSYEKSENVWPWTMKNRGPKMDQNPGGWGDPIRPPKTAGSDIIDSKT